MNKDISAPRLSYGYFSPNEPFWWVNREWLVILAGARALLLELAHPMVAAGVAQHSNFRRDPLGRLYRTIRMMIDISFGQTDRALNAVARVNRCHRPVEGVLGEKVEALGADTPYRANDPHLKLWVWATLIDSILVTHDWFVRPLSLAEKEVYYRDSQRLGRLFGIPAQVIPATYHDFMYYMDMMVMGDELTVSDTARGLVEAIFAPPLGLALRLASFAGIGLLPARLRADFNLSWSDRQERRLRGLAKFLRQVRACLPTFVCVQPEALVAEWWLRRSGGFGVTGRIRRKSTHTS